MGFSRFSENKVAVAAAALVERPPHCSHSNFIFADVDISKVLATFCVDVDAALRGRTESEPLRLCKHCLGKNYI